MSSPGYHSPPLSSCGKRPRTPETPDVPSFQETLEDAEEPFSKMPRSSVPSSTSTSNNPNTNTKNNHDQSTSDNKNESLPLAPRFSDYMAPGGTVRYRPRPEWYLPKNSTRNRKNAPNAGKEGVARVAAAPVAALDEHDDEDVLLQAAQGQRNPEIPVANQNDNNGIVIPIEYVDDDDASSRLVYQQQEQPQAPPSVAASADSSNPSLLVAPADGLLPQDSFRDYSVIQETVAAGSGGGSRESPPPPKRLAVDASTAAAVGKTAQAAVATNTDAKIAAKPCYFGKDWDTALNLAIRENATEAALALLALNAEVDFLNAKGITPLILASQKGNCTVVRELLKRGANPGTSSTNGTTALLQAAHFGHGNVVELLLLKGGPGLMELSNYNHTTPLMRASQVCALLVDGVIAVVVVLLVCCCCRRPTSHLSPSLASFLMETTGRKLGNLPQPTCLGSAGQS
jgi:hypothetical protein